MTTTGPSSTPQPIVPSTTIALIVYVLYFVGYFTGITALIGVIMAHVQVDTAEPMLATHYRFQIRTFWVGLLYLAGASLSLMVIGAAATFLWYIEAAEVFLWFMGAAAFFLWFIGVLWWLIWSLARNIKGVLALNEHRR